jgi:hypothetical protein
MLPELDRNGLLVAKPDDGKYRVIGRTLCSFNDYIFSLKLIVERVKLHATDCSQKLTRRVQETW